MTTGSTHLEARPPGAGQIVLPRAAPFLAPADQLRILSGLSDPALSEVGLDELLDEVLVRVQQALEVDTVAILLYDPESHELVARAAKGIEEEVEQGVRLPLGKGFAGRIAAERVAIAIGDVDHADILNPILRDKRIRSLLGLPLVVEGDLIGVLHVGSLVPRTFGERDLAVLQVAAARIAPGIERARLYSELEREHRLAVVLQRSLLPRELAGVVGVGVAARYLPARDGVGGDWYDVIELPHGLVGIAIGDVVGHGMRAAALMGEVRFALHAYALEGHAPGRTLELVDRYVQTMRERPMATAAYAVFDAETGSLTLATAGHLPPIIFGPTRAGVDRSRAGSAVGRVPIRELSRARADAGKRRDDRRCRTRCAWPASRAPADRGVGARRWPASRPRRVRGGLRSGYPTAGTSGRAPARPGARSSICALSTSSRSLSRCWSPPAGTNG